MTYTWLYLWIFKTLWLEIRHVWSVDIVLCMATCRFVKLFLSIWCKWVVFYQDHSSAPFFLYGIWGVPDPNFLSFFLFSKRNLRDYKQWSLKCFLSFILASVLFKAPSFFFRIEFVGVTKVPWPPSQRKGEGW